LNTGINTINAAALAGSLTLASGSRDADAYTITGGVNNDQLSMENVADVIVAGANVALSATASAAVTNADTLTINYTGIVGGISVDLSAADQVVTMDGSANAAVQSGFENIDLSSYAGFAGVVTGSDLANRIVGTGAADRIVAGKGNDTIVVNTGTVANSDQMNGGAGSDTLEIATGLTVTIDGDTDIVSVETINLTAQGVVILTGQSEAFTITAGAGTSSITGGTGNDTITLADDSGNDQILFTNAGLDTIGGFTIGEDHLVMSGIADITGVTGNSVDSAANASATDLGDGLIICFAKGDDGVNTSAITDYLDMTNVATFLAANLAEANNEHYVAIINDQVGDDVYVYLSIMFNLPLMLPR